MSKVKNVFDRWYTKWIEMHQFEIEALMRVGR